MTAGATGAGTSGGTDILYREFTRAGNDVFNPGFA